jgi:nucleoside 2-deoxyribosyltransferase
MSAVMSKQKRATEAFKFLVLLPFDASARQLRDVINTTIRQEQGEPLFLDENKAGALWVEEVSRLVSTSGAVIADVTRRNPNVMFELGVAHALGKPLVLLLDEDANTNLPSGLAGYQYLTYSRGNFSPLISRLGKTIGQIVQRREAV